MVFTLWPKSPRTGPQLVAESTQNLHFLCGPSLPEMFLLCGPSPEMAPTLKLKSPRFCFRLAAQVSPKSALMHGRRLPEMAHAARPESPRIGPYCVTQVSPKWPTLLPGFTRNGFLPRGPRPSGWSLLCGPSPHELIPIAWPQTPRNNPYLSGHVSPKCYLLCGPGHPGMIFIVWPRSPRNGVLLVAQISPQQSPTCDEGPQTPPHCVAQVSPKCSLLCGPSLDMAPTLKPKSPRNCPRVAAQVSLMRSRLHCPRLPQMAHTARPKFLRIGLYSLAQVCPT